MSLALLTWPPPIRCPACNDLLPCAHCEQPHGPRKIPKRCADKVTHRLATATRAGWRCTPCAEKTAGA